MTPVGETLRRERQRRNLELEQISRELRISVRFLEAIEAEEFERLPGTVFARSFVRQYASLLDLDGEGLSSQIGRPAGPEDAHRPPAHAATGMTIPDIHVPRMEGWQSVGDGARFNWSSSLPAFGMVVLVMLGLSAVYAWWQRPISTPAAPPPLPQAAVQSDAPPAVPAAEPAPVASEPTASEPVASEPASQPDGGQATVSRDAAPPAEPPPAASGAGVRVELVAEEPVWVLAQADGKYLFSGTLEPNQTRTVEAVSRLLLRFGNAGGVSVTLNGKPIGSMGPKGQVRTVQFTSGGFQIVPAAKPSVTPAP